MEIGVHGANRARAQVKRPLQNLTDFLNEADRFQIDKPGHSDARAQPGPTLLNLQFWLFNASRYACLSITPPGRPVTPSTRSKEIFPDRLSPYLAQNGYIRNPPKTKSAESLCPPEIRLNFQLRKAPRATVKVS